LLVNTTIPVMATSSFVPSAQLTTVDPPSLALTLERGESVTETITVTTAPTPIPKVDVLFLFDVTGSMADVIEAAKVHGVFIMNTLKAKVSDAAFGVASFADYPGKYDYADYTEEYGASSDYPWALGVDITTDTAAVQRGIEALYLLDGKDGPEAYSRALFEALYDVSWRPDAKHIIVLFGDSTAHDPNFFSSYGYNLGVDPGVDALAGTPDDLHFADVVAQVKDRGIQIIPINSDLNNVDYVQAGFEYMATETGGEVYSLDEAEDLPDVVAAGLTAATSVISSLSIIPDADYEDWVQVTPTVHPNVSGGEIRTFEVTITVPTDTELGQHDFALTVAGDFATLGGTLVNVTVGGIVLDPAEIKSKKYQLIKDLSTPEFETEFLKARFTWAPEPENTYAADEQAVKVWLDGLDWDNLTPAELAAVHRLTVQEEALQDLIQAQAKTSHISNAQIAHIVGLIFSVVSIVKFLDKLEGKHVVGLLVTKLRNYVYSKLLGLVVTVIEWFTGQLPPDPTLELFRTEIKVIGEIFKEHFENSLKDETLTGDFLKKLLADAMVYPLDRYTNEIYVRRTENLVPHSLSTAQQMTQMSIALDDVQGEAALVLAQVSDEMGVVKSEQQSLEVLAERTEATQNTVSIISDFANTTSTLLSLTGLGTLPAQIGHVISLVLKLIDAVLSASLGYKSYNAWWLTPDAATNVTTLAFAYGPTPPTLIAFDRSPPFILTATGAHAATTNISSANTLARIVPTDLPPTSALSDYTISQLAQLEADMATYLDLLDQLAVAVRTGDIKTAEAVTEQLLEADQSLNDTFLIARQPIFAGARSVINSGTGGFEAAYSDFGRSAAAFDGQGAILYVYLIGWFYDPTNTESQQLLLEQIETVRSSTESYQADLAAALPYVEEVATQPSVLVTGYTLPDLQVGQTAILRVEISNPTPNPAQNVTILFNPGQNAQIVGQDSFSLGSLAGGTTTTLEIPFIPDNEEGILTLSTSASNGSGTFRVIPFIAIVIESRGWGGFGIVIILLVLIVGMVAVIAISRRRAGQLGISTAAKAQLIGLTGPWAGRSVAIPTGGLTIGRGATNTLRISDRSVSRQHAVIRYAQGRYYLQDQGSQHGTYVNGQRIDAVPLSLGDCITIGDTEFEFRLN
jgi:hypothetical protein